MTHTNWVILVDEQDREIGIAEKLFAHEHARLHRAFSVFIFRKAGENRELLLQQRALGKYHTGGLWTNTCCSHPSTGEALLTTAERRLQEEMGIQTPLSAVGRFHYKAQVGQGLIENEMDHVLVGTYPGEPVINQQEVADYRWVNLKALEADLLTHPEHYTPWLAEALRISLKGEGIVILNAKLKL